MAMPTFPRSVRTIVASDYAPPPPWDVREFFDTIVQAFTKALPEGYETKHQDPLTGRFAQFYTDEEQAVHTVLAQSTVQGYEDARSVNVQIVVGGPDAEAMFGNDWWQGDAKNPDYWVEVDLYLRGENVGYITWSREHGWFDVDSLGLVGLGMLKDADAASKGLNLVKALEEAEVLNEEALIQEEMSAPN